MRIYSCCMKYNCIMFCHTHSPPSSSLSSSNILCQIVLVWSWEDNENMRTLGILALGFSSVSTFDATEMMRRRFHALHSKHELFRWNSHCFVTCAPLDLAMHYPWCYIATRKILISNKHIANFGLQIFCPQISSCSTPRPCGFPKYLRTKYACLRTYSSRKWIYNREIWGNIISKNNRYECGLERQFTL